MTKIDRWGFALVLLALILFTTTKVRCQEKPDWQPAIVGLGLIVAPAIVAGNEPGMDVPHLWELEGFGYTMPAVGECIFEGLGGDKETSRILAGAISALSIIGYRKAEGGNPGINDRKLFCDLSGVGAWLTIHKF